MLTRFSARQRSPLDEIEREKCTFSTRRRFLFLKIKQKEEQTFEEFVTAQQANDTDCDNVDRVPVDVATRPLFVEKNKKPTNWWGRRNAAQLNWKISADILCVISGDLAQTVSELLLFAGYTFTRYSVTLYSQPEVASEVTSSTVVE